MALFRCGTGAKNKAYFAHLGAPNTLDELSSGTNTFNNLSLTAYISCGDNFSTLAVTLSGGFDYAYAYKKDGTSQQLSGTSFTLDCSEVIGALFSFSTPPTFTINATV